MGVKTSIDNMISQQFSGFKNLRSVYSICKMWERKILGFFAVDICNLGSSAISRNEQ